MGKNYGINKLYLVSQTDFRQILELLYWDLNACAGKYFDWCNNDIWYFSAFVIKIFNRYAIYEHSLITEKYLKLLTHSHCNVVHVKPLYVQVCVQSLQCSEENAFWNHFVHWYIGEEKCIWKTDCFIKMLKNLELIIFL